MDCKRSRPVDAWCPLAFPFPLMRFVEVRNVRGVTFKMAALRDGQTVRIDRFGQSIERTVHPLAMRSFVAHAIYGQRRMIAIVFMKFAQMPKRIIYAIFCATVVVVRKFGLH